MKRFASAILIIFTLGQVILPSFVVQATINNEVVHKDEAKEGSENDSIPSEEYLKTNDVEDLKYSTEKRVQKSVYKMSEYDPNMEKEEFADDINSMQNIDYLINKTDSNFEIALAFADGSYSYFDSANDINDAIEIANNVEKKVKSNIIPCVIDSNGVVVYSTNSMGRILKHIGGKPYYGVNKNTSIYKNSNLTNEINYINQGYVDDVPIIVNQANSAKIQVSGQIGWVNKNVNSQEYDLIIVPLNQAYNPSYYQSINGILYHWISTDITNRNMTAGHKVAVGVAPQWMVNEKKYYSYDGKYFYNSLNEVMDDLKADSKGRAVNKNNPYYNYYLYLPFRSKTSYSASDIDRFISQKAPSNSALRGSGKGFISAQDKYGSNAMLMLGIAINESNWGTSNYAINKNNLFGLGAYDSNPNDSFAYKSVAHCIEEFGNYWVSKGYSDPQDWRYMGGYLGTKDLGFNVKYASDPFWGEKAASYAFLADRTLSNNNISLLNDYNQYQLAIINSPTTVQFSNGNSLYNVKSGKVSSCGLVGESILLTSNVKQKWGSGYRYEINPARTSALPLTGGSEFNGLYDWNTKGYIDATKVTLVNNPQNATGINYQVSLSGNGWQPWNSNGYTAGNQNGSSGIEGFKVKFTNLPQGSSITYRSYVQGNGWLSWVKDGQTSGLLNQGKKISAIQINANLPKGYALEYRVYNDINGWESWVKSGDISGTYGRDIKAIEIKIVEDKPISVLSPGIYEEDNSNIRYYGDWTSWSSNIHSGGKSIYSNETSAAIEFKFKGTGLKLFGYTNNEKGLARIVVDGKTENTIDTYTKNGESKKMIYQRTNLENKEHTVRIEVTGMKNPSAISDYLNLDYIQVIGDKAPAIELVDDKDPSVIFKGQWTDWKVQDHYNGSTKYSNVKGNSIEYTFYGTGIRILGYTNQEKGIADVYVDGNKYSIDTFTSRSVYKNTIFELTGLTKGKHTIKVVVANDKNSRAIGSYVNFDAFEVIEPFTPSVLEKGIYEEYNTAIKKGGSWTVWNDSAHSGGRTIYSNDKSAYIEFKFKGTGFKLFGSSNNEKGIGKVIIDGVAVNNFDSYTKDRYNKRNMYQRTGLSNGEHTVRIEVTGLKNPSAVNSYLNIDYIEIVNESSPATKLVEENSKDVKYTGSWTSWTDSGHSGKTTKYSNGVNNSIEYTFYGTGIRVLGFTNSEKGIANVYVDGKLYSIDTYTEGRIYKNNIFELTGLSQGKHKIKIEVTGKKNSKAVGSYINIDAFEVINPSAEPVLTAGKYEENNSGIELSGSWTVWNDSAHSGGRTIYSNDKSAYIEFKFKGTGFKLFGSSNNEKGIGKVIIDGVAVNNFDSYTKDRYNKRNMYQRTGLSNGEHTVRIEVTGLKNPSAVNSYLNIDYIEIVNESSPATKLVEENSKDVKYTGSWTSWTDSGHSGKTTKYSNGVNNSIEYTFYGTGIRVLGFTNSEKGIANVYVDGKLYSIDTYTEGRIYKNNIFELTGLSKGKHTIKIEVTGKKNSNAVGSYINIDAFEIFS